MLRYTASGAVYLVHQFFSNAECARALSLKHDYSRKLSVFAGAAGTAACFSAPLVFSSSALSEGVHPSRKSPGPATLSTTSTYFVQGLSLLNTVRVDLQASVAVLFAACCRQKFKLCCRTKSRRPQPLSSPSLYSYSHSQPTRIYRSTPAPIKLVMSGVQQVCGVSLQRKDDAPPCCLSPPGCI